jgi:hypothetical protein
VLPNVNATTRRSLRIGARRTGLWYVPRAVEGSRRTLLATGLAVFAISGVAVGCGGGERQDADEPSGTYKVAVEKASFPARQRLAQQEEFRVLVRNDDSKTIPDVAVTITSDDPKNPTGGFTTRSQQAGLADDRRPIWIVDRGPYGGGTAYVGTWTLGPLPAGQSREFVWKVTAVQPGTHTVRYRVAAGLNGKAKAQTAAGDEAAGSFRVDIDAKPSDATVDPETGDVVRSPQQ